MEKTARSEKQKLNLEKIDDFFFFKINYSEIHKH